MPQKPCSFSVDFEESAEALAGRARQAISGAGGQFEGGAEDGCFTLASPMGSVEGHYHIAGQTIHVTLSKKPRAVPCKRIEALLAAYLTA